MCQYLYSCASKASKLSTSSAKFLSVTTTLLYCYTSTNTALLVQQYSVCLLDWHKTSDLVSKLHVGDKALFVLVYTALSY